MKKSQLRQIIKEEILNTLNEEMYDTIRDLKRAGYINASRRDVEEYLGYTLDNYKLQAFKEAGIIR